MECRRKQTDIMDDDAEEESHDVTSVGQGMYNFFRNMFSRQMMQRRRAHEGSTTGDDGGASD